MMNNVKSGGNINFVPLGNKSLFKAKQIETQCQVENCEGFHIEVVKFRTKS